MELCFRIVGLSLALATPVAAAVLPIEGAYGDEAGCNFYNYGAAPAGSFMLLTPDTMASARLSCEFASIVDSEGSRLTVAAVCSPGGKLQLEVVADAKGNYSVRTGDVVVGPAPPCPRVPALPQGTVAL